MCLQYKSFENTEGKGEIAHKEQFLLFPQCFLPIWKTLCYFHQIWYCHLQTLSVWKSLNLILLFGKGLILYQAISSFIGPWKTAFWKHYWKGGNAGNFLLFQQLHITSNFSFSHSVYKRCVLQTRKNQPGLVWEGLRSGRGVEFLCLTCLTWDFL